MGLFGFGKNNKNSSAEPQSNEEKYGQAWLLIVGQTERARGLKMMQELDRAGFVKGTIALSIDSVAEFTEQAFKMYGGEPEDVVLQFDRALVEPVFDKFGEDVPMMPVNDDTLAATVHVQISPTFFGWLAQFGGRMKVLSPDNVVAQYKKHIAGITKDNS